MLPWSSCWDDDIANGHRGIFAISSSHLALMLLRFYLSRIRNKTWEINPFLVSSKRIEPIQHP